MCFICVINVSVCPNYFSGFIYVGPGARLAASLEGRGAQLWRHPGSKYFRSRIKWSLGLKHFVLEGVM